MKKVLLLAFCLLIANINIFAQQEEIYVIVDEIPEFPGGVAKMNEYLSNSIIYPEYAVNNNIEGKVVLEFVVDIDGAITDIKIKQTVHESLDNEALRIVKSMPKWKPGKNDGKFVRVKYTLPINFRLDLMPKFSSDEEKIEFFLRSNIEQNINIQITELGVMETFLFPIVRYKYQTPEIYEDKINDNKEIFEYIQSLSESIKISYFIPAVVSFKEPNEEAWSPAWYLVLMNENKDIIEMVSYYP